MMIEGRKMGATDSDGDMLQAFVKLLSRSCLKGFTFPMSGLQTILGMKKDEVAKVA